MEGLKALTTSLKNQWFGYKVLSWTITSQVVLTNKPSLKLFGCSLTPGCLGMGVSTMLVLKSIHNYIQSVLMVIVITRASG